MFVASNRADAADNFSVEIGCKSTHIFLTDKIFFLNILHLIDFKYFIFINHLSLYTHPSLVEHPGNEKIKTTMHNKKFTPSFMYS